MPLGRLGLRQRPCPTGSRVAPAATSVIDPDVRFGAPSVGGISTAILWEQAEGGEDEQDLADIYGLTLQQVRWALTYEATQAADRAKPSTVRFYFDADVLGLAKLLCQERAGLHPGRLRRMASARRREGAPGPRPPKV